MKIWKQDGWRCALVIKYNVTIRHPNFKTRFLKKKHDTFYRSSCSLRCAIQKLLPQCSTLTANSICPWFFWQDIRGSPFKSLTLLIHPPSTKKLEIIVWQHCRNVNQNYINYLWTFHQMIRKSQTFYTVTRIIRTSNEFVRVFNWHVRHLFPFLTNVGLLTQPQNHFSHLRKLQT